MAGEALPRVCSALSQGIKKAKRSDEGVIPGHLCDTGDARWVQQEIRPPMDYKIRQQAGDAGASPPDGLDNFLAGFAVPNAASPAVSPSDPPALLNLVQDTRILTRADPIYQTLAAFLSITDSTCSQDALTSQ